MFYVTEYYKKKLFGAQVQVIFLWLRKITGIIFWKNAILTADFPKKEVLKSIAQMEIKHDQMVSPPKFITLFGISLR
jgi:hypothetical protein